MPRAIRFCLLMLLALDVAPAALADHEDAEDDWPTAQGDLARTGSRGHVPGPGTGDVIWRFQTPDLSVAGWPAIAGGRVMFTGGDGMVYAVDAMTGKLAWSQQIDDDIESPFPGPVVANGTVFVAGRHRDLYALDQATGALRWRFDHPVASLLGVTYDKGTLYVGSSGTLYALDASNGTLVWAHEEPERIDGLLRRRLALAFSPVVAGDMVLSSVADGHLLAVHQDNGTLAWRIRLSLWASQQIATDGTVVYAVSDWGDGTVYAVDPAEGTIVWNWTIDRDIFVPQGPSVNNGTVIVTGRNGVVALDASNGGLLWANHDMHDGGIYAAVTDDSVYVIPGTGQVFALSIRDGKTQWSHEIAAYTGWSIPAVANGILYTGTEQFRFLALDAGAGGEHLPDVIVGDPSKGQETPLPSFPFAVLAVLAALGALGRRAERYTG